MAMQELYIRNPTDTEARGPFTSQQVADLAEAGQVTPETLTYDATTEQWVALSVNPDLMAAVFPTKKKLGLKKTEIKILNRPEEGAKAITVNDMLNAAEGLTDDTKGKGDPQVAMMRAAKLGMIGGIATLAVAAVAEILPGTEALVSMDPAKLINHPLAILGVIDLALAVLLGLGVTSLYPFVRFRAALGLGLLGFMYYAQGASMPLLAAVAGSTGLYLCTVCVSLIPVIFAAAAGIGGMGLLAWLVLAN